MDKLKKFVAEASRGLEERERLQKRVDELESAKEMLENEKAEVERDID